MITNTSITIYHKGLDNTTKLETWTRYNYDNVWYFDTENSNMNKGYDNANRVNIRIPYEKNKDLNISNFKKGDIIVKGHLDIKIETQQDLSGYEIYNITTINNNTFGKRQHIHIGGI